MADDPLAGSVDLLADAEDQLPPARGKKSPKPARRSPANAADSFNNNNSFGGQSSNNSSFSHEHVLLRQSQLAAASTSFDEAMGIKNERSSSPNNSPEEQSVRKPRRTSFSAGVRRGSLLGVAEAASEFISVTVFQKDVTYTPLRILQASPLSHYLNADSEDFRNLSKFFIVHHFSAGEAIPPSPMYLVAAGLVNVHTNTGGHEPVTHGRGCFLVTVNAQQQISKRPKPTSVVYSCLCGSYDDEWDDEDDEDDDEDEIHPVIAPPINTPPGLTNSWTSKHWAEMMNSGQQGMPPGRVTSAAALGGIGGGGGVPGGAAGLARANTYTELLGVGSSRASAPPDFRARSGSRVSNIDTNFRRGSRGGGGSRGSNYEAGSGVIGLGNHSGRRPSKGGGGLPNKPGIRSSRQGSDTWAVSPLHRSMKAKTSVTAVTEGDILLCHDVAKVHKLLKLSPPTHAAVHDVSRLEEMLLELPLFLSSYLTNTARQQLRDLITYRACPEGQRIQGPDDNGEAFYIIMRGGVTVHADQHVSIEQARRSQRLSAVGSNSFSSSSSSSSFNKRYKPIKQHLTEGQFFGGASLFKDARPRRQGGQGEGNAELEVYASSKTLLACVSEANFARLLAVDENVRRQLLLEAKRRLLSSFRWARVPFFVEMSDNTINKFAELATLVTVEPGSAIETLTDETRGMYIIADGEVEAQARKAPPPKPPPDPQQGRRSPLASILSPTPSEAARLADQDVRDGLTSGGALSEVVSESWTLSYGHYFGEMGLMLPTAPITVELSSGFDEVTLLCLKEAEFVQLFHKDKMLLAELRMRVHQQNASLTTILEHSRARTLFIEYLRKSGGGGEARLAFYEAVTQYLQLEPSGFQKAARAIAEGILKEYVPNHAIGRVELSNALRSEGLAALTEGNLDKYPEVLRRMREEVFFALKGIYLRAFTSSEPFTDLLKALSQGGADLSTDLHKELEA